MISPRPLARPARTRRSVALVAVALVAVALVAGGLARTVVGQVTGSGCVAAEKALVPVLAAEPILAAHPAGAVQRARHSGCFRDDPFPYAGRLYEFGGDFTAYYARAAAREGWRPFTAAEGTCYTKTVGGATAFLSVAAHEAGGVRGYGIDVAATHDPPPEDGGLLC
ncbi:hypothetical protein [Nonomuraea indica]|uniref:hypothetical protein n=1 Tax=Nonomuraea indica TaxID=1581193 RepID=UPI000C7C3A12|nr:hypothetical protein [Nonomuraea indica]